MTKPFLYIDPVGTLLIDSDHPDRFLDAGIAPYAGTFLNWATKHFNVRWLTTASPTQTFHLAERLGVQGHAIPFASFAESKSDAIREPHASFWIDTHLTPNDATWLNRHGVTERFLPVNRVEGVSEQHQKWLAGKLNSKRR